MLRLSLFALLRLPTRTSELDALEEMRFEQFLAGFVNPCDLFLFDGSHSGRSNAADWIRTAYHDMATHNVADGTGGMDGSDAGDGFQNTIEVLADQANRYVSIADVLALGLVLAVENCGGPEIAFRGGRVDATEPNAPGVPQPQEGLDSHIASFARQGFTQTEMIGLVACGHTFGGVQHAPFPDIVPELNDPNSTQAVVHFDSTFVNFDNNIATEYISGTTQNPLVVGLNDTTNSDKRIFGSDGNVTMLSFANSPELFASTCAELFAKMIDTVPRDVQLTDVLTPLPFWNMSQKTNSTVRLLWDDHVGGTNNVTLSVLGGFTNSGGRHTGAFYAFSQPFLAIDAAAGITKMRFTVDDRLEDQGGLGFPLQDGVVLSTSSCIDFNSDGSITGHIDIGVRNIITPTRVFVEGEVFEDSGRPIVVEIDVPPPSEPAAANATYSIWSVPVNLEQEFNFFTIGAEVDGVGKLLGPHQPAFFSSC
ncbi:heme peroxidase [Mycena leptocephala]|nr:heme peroxidase [Mycena leptocephala]